MDKEGNRRNATVIQGRIRMAKPGRGGDNFVKGILFIMRN